MAETYNAGTVTAYGAAVRGGYTGTYEQFCADMADLGENVQAVAQAKTDVEAMQGQVREAVEGFIGTTVPAAVETVQNAGTAQVQAVQDEGTMQAAAVETVGAQQRQAVEAAGETATGAVGTAQAAAVQAVQNESSTQQAAVQAKGAEVLASIPADYTELAGDVEALTSAIPQSIETVIGDNVLPLKTDSYTTGGITWSTDAENGTVIANGTASRNEIYGFLFAVQKTGKYYLAGCANGGSPTQWYMRVVGKGDDYGAGVEMELSAGTSYTFWIVIVNGRTADNLVFTPSLVYDESTILSVEKIAKSLPYKAQIPPLFEGGMSCLTGKYYHDANETWIKTRIRTNAIKIMEGAEIENKSSVTYRLSVCSYADFGLDNFISGESLGVVSKWVCPKSGYYSLTFMRNDAKNLAIDSILNDWDFTKFYCEVEEKIFVHWIGSGNLDETSTASDVGDCSMVVFPDGEGLLIDSGNARNYSSLRKRLAEAGFYHIKNIIISHFHGDHVGGLIQMVTDGLISIEGATVYLPDYNATLWAYNNGVMESATKTYYDSAMALFESNNCVLIYPDSDFKPYEFGGAVLSFFNTDLSVYEGVSTNYNDWSLCNYIFYGNMNVCFAGDIGPIAQGQLGGKLYKSIIYKADHHGWLNSTTMPADYINNVSPDVVIAMDGQTHDDLLQTDKAPLIQWCEKNGVPYYRKYQNNEIITAISKNSWAFENKVKRYFRP